MNTRENLLEGVLEDEEHVYVCVSIFRMYVYVE